MRDIPVNRSATDSMRQSNLMLSPRHNPIRSGSSCRSPYASAYLPLLNKHEAPATPGIRDLNQTLVADYKFCPLYISRPPRGLELAQRETGSGWLDCISDDDVPLDRGMLFFDGIDQTFRIPAPRMTRYLVYIISSSTLDDVTCSGMKTLV